jgi:hypothetical protein
MTAIRKTLVRKTTLRRKMTLRRLVVWLALTSGLGLAHAASAAPDSVGQYHVDNGTAVVRGSDGLTYLVSVELRATVGKPSQVAVATVKYKACKRNGSCGFTYTYSLTLAATQVTFADANTASVTTKLLGQPLRLQWSAKPGAPGSSISARADIPDAVAVGDPTSGGSADFTATLFGVQCGGDGTVVNEYGAFTSPTAGSSNGPSHAPAGFITKRGHKPGCQSSA